MNETDVKNIYHELKRLAEHTEKQNSRIGKLENWRSFILGGLSIISLFILMTTPELLRYYILKP